jgi:hypothetical protein
MKEMNEKLKQLYLCSFAPSISDSAVCEEGAKKFAELIVRECGEYLMRPEFIGRSDLDWSMVLNEHFGVEE